MLVHLNNGSYQYLKSVIIPQLEYYDFKQVFLHPSTHVYLLLVPSSDTMKTNTVCKLHGYSILRLQ